MPITLRSRIANLTTVTRIAIAVVFFGAFIFIAQRWAGQGHDADLAAQRPMNPGLGLQSREGHVGSDPSHGGTQVQPEWTDDSYAASATDGTTDGESIREMHKFQALEIDAMLSNLDAVVIETEDGKKITAREVRQLHASQNDVSGQYDTTEVVIPADENGSPAMTVADVLSLHKEQRRIRLSKDTGSEVVTITGESGDAELTVAQVRDLHRQQSTSSEDPAGAAAPLPELPVWPDGDFTTVDEIKALHEQQSQR